ncbi:hypothetical protein MGH68_00290 [Erysipelothrix sp. D19-032]
MIRHFIFDMGNVLIDFNPDYILSHFTTDIHELGKLKSYVFGGDTWLKLDNGDISIDDAYYEIARHVHRNFIMKHFTKSYIHGLTIPLVAKR